MEPTKAPVPENGRRGGLPGSHQLQPSDANNDGLQQPSSHESQFPHRHQERSPSESTSSSADAIEWQKKKWIARGHLDAATSQLSYWIIHEEGCDEVATLAAKLAILMAICVVGELCAKDRALQEKLELSGVPWKPFVKLRNLIFKPTCQRTKISILEGSIDDSRVSFKSLFYDLEHVCHVLSHLLCMRERPTDFHRPIPDFSGTKQLKDLLETKDSQRKEKGNGFQVVKNERTRYFELLLKSTKDILQPPNIDNSLWRARLNIQRGEGNHHDGVMGILSRQDFKLTPYQKIVRSATTLNMIQIVGLFSTYNFKVHPDSEIIRNQASHLRLQITDFQGKHATKKFLTRLFSKEEVFTDFIQLHDWRDSGMLRVRISDSNAATGVSVYIEGVSADVDLQEINQEAKEIFKDSVSQPDILGFFRAGKFDPIIKALKADHSSIGINKQDHNGNTLVHLILMRADEFIHREKFLGVAVTCFKQKGLKLDITNNEELTPICLFKKLSDETKKRLRQILCEENVPVSVMRLFLDGSDYDPDEIVDPKSGRRLLHKAAEKGHLELVKYLLLRSPKSAHPLLLCKHGRLPLYYAERKNHLPTITLLEESTTRAQLFNTLPMSHLLTADHLPST